MEKVKVEKDGVIKSIPVDYKKDYIIAGWKEVKGEYPKETPTYNR